MADDEKQKQKVSGPKTSVKFIKKRSAVIKPREKNKYSNFHVTISSNYRPKDSTDEAKVTDSLEQAFNTMINEEQYQKRIIRFLGDKQDMSLLLDIGAVAAVEVGSTKKGGRLHLHSSIRITHRSKIQLNPKEIQTVMGELLDDYARGRIKQFYVHVNAYKSGREVLDYILKNQDLAEEDLADLLSKNSDG